MIKKIVNIMFFWLFLTHPLNASQEYGKLIITKTTHERNLNIINDNLSRVGIKMYIQKKENYFVVYSQKFSTKESAERALMRVKKIFPYAEILVRSKSRQEKSSKEEKNIFISIAGGNASSSGSADTNSGMSYMLEGGYYFNKNIFTSFAYLNSSTPEIDMQSIYFSLNYKYNFTKKFGVYSGVLAGYGTLALTGEVQSSNSVSLIFGGQIGISYDILEYLSLYSAVQYMALDHIIEYSVTQSISFNSTLNAQLGVSFKF